MPALTRIMTAEDLLDFRKAVALERMNACETDDALSVVYRKLPERLRHDEAVIARYCDRLSSESAAEVVLRDALDREWMPALLDRYGGLGEETLARRLRTAQNWLRSHPDDAALQLCLGRLYETAGEPQQATRAYQRSVDLDGPAAASRHLGRMLAIDGRYKESSDAFSRALAAD